MSSGDDMGATKMIHKTFTEGVEGQTVARVTFTLPDTVWADRIALVGDFNNWNTQSHPFSRNGSGAWTITVDLEPRRAYQFRYFQDNRQWINDSSADACIHNIYGSDNFIVITDPDFKRHSDERTSSRWKSQ